MHGLPEVDIWSGRVPILSRPTWWAVTEGKEGYVKVRLRAPDGMVETPWAEALGSNRFRLDNIPILAYGVSTDDIIVAEPEEDGVLGFKQVEVPSGNRTLRLVFEEKVTKEEPMLQRLTAMGVGWEGLHAKMFALSVPPEIDLDEVVRMLGQSGLLWEYANPTWDDLHAQGKV